MAKFTELNETEWQKWLETRPLIIQEVARRVRPDILYRMKDSGHRCYLYSYCDDGTVTVVVSGEYNRVLFSRRVFGVDPSSLVECDLPRADEDVGDTSEEAGYTEEDIETILMPRLRNTSLFNRNVDGGDE